MPEMIRDGVLSWATELDEETADQAARTARLPFIAGHVALMADAHLGYGATVGSVIPTRGAVIPAAVGVDIGCGMVAVDTTLDATHLPDDLRPLLRKVQQRVPAGVGQGHDHERRGEAWIAGQRDRTGHTPQLVRSGKGATKAAQQFGTLGSGNHFAEVALDEDDHVWAVVHSGSRGTGFQIAQQHMGVAKQLADAHDRELEDANLAWLDEGTEEFDAYLRDLRWAQDYARGNRERMMELVLRALAEEVGRPEADLERDRFDCHHNYTVEEEHDGEQLWITRKGAIRAREGDRGIIPGSMGTASYIVTGRGSADAFDSASHGAGRRMSRTQAKEELELAEFEQQMQGRVWLSHASSDLLDEAPDAYKDIDEVMAAQADLVEVDHQLRAVLNFKGT